MNKKTLFISDLHLDENYPQIASCFFYFLEQLDKKVEALYILGDFFNAWPGDDEDSPFYLKIQAALKKASQDRPVYFMPGNRDFLVGRRFSEKTGCQLIKDPTLIDLYGVPTLLLHGDSLCIQDARHLRFRAISQHPFVKFVFLKLPLKIRKKATELIRTKSRQHLSTVFDHSALVQSEVQRIMLKSGVYQMIHGHMHSHIIYPVDLKGQKGECVVLGDWDDLGSILVCEPKSLGKGSLNTLIRFSQ